MRRGASGRRQVVSAIGGERVTAFVPSPLPPTPPLVINGELRDKLDRAHLALGRLDSVTALLPDTQFFLYMYVRKEAVLSSQIEGTQSSLSDLLLFEADDVAPAADVVEVANYVAAMDHGMKRTREGFPLSTRLIREIHKVLLRTGRGTEKQPGEFRRSQNWIGGSRPGNAVFVPPPPELVAECMGTLEQWLHDKPEKTPTVLKAALSHVQFETIHPFLDGNGRVGRVLITLLLCTEGVLDEPLLYLSLYLKQNRRRYYELLTTVRESGDWEAWVAFFADGVADSAGSAVQTARRLADLAAADRIKIGKEVGRAAGTALRIHHEMLQRPIRTATQLSSATGISLPTILNGLRALSEIGVVSEVTGRRRNMIFSYAQYLGILSEGTEPLES
jgi:Fic family protein